MNFIKKNSKVLSIGIVGGILGAVALYSLFYPATTTTEKLSRKLSSINP